VGLYKSISSVVKMVSHLKGLLRHSLASHPERRKPGNFVTNDLLLETIAARYKQNIEKMRRGVFSFFFLRKCVCVCFRTI